MGSGSSYLMIWKYDIIENPSTILILGETLVAPTSTMIVSDSTGNLSPPSPIVEEKFALPTSPVVAYEPTIEEFSTVLELEADNKPPPL